MRINGDGLRWNRTAILGIMGVLIAMVILLSRVLRVDLGFARFTLGSVCTVMGGIWFGPAAGGLIGGVADLLGSFLQGYAPNPLITVSAVLWGVIPALMLRYVDGTKGRKVLILSLSVVLTSLVCTMGFTYAGLVLMLGYDYRAILPARLLQFAGMTPVYCILVCSLYFSPVTKYLRKTVGIYEPAGKAAFYDMTGEDRKTAGKEHGLSGSERIS